MFRYTFAIVSSLMLASSAWSQLTANFPAPKTLGPVEKYGANLQRSMSLMATSTGLKRNTVRILFYGQSITTSDWTRIVAERLRRQYPLADFVIENRAIPGFFARWLSNTAESDLYPYYPDLVIFHDYGDAAPYEAMIRRIRERTTADILIATDHMAPRLGETMDEVIDPAKLREPKLGDHDGAWRSYYFLPRVAKKYDAELADVRTLWKQYLNDHKLKPTDLLYDELHLNAHGNYLMAEMIGAHLRYRPDLKFSLEDDDRRKTYTVGEERDLQWKNGKLVLTFEGNKVDFICKDGGQTSPAAVRIDGKKPSEFPELYVPTRTEMVSPQGAIPAVLRVRAQQQPVVEDWRIFITGISQDYKSYKIRVVGSVTGDDGEGEGGKRFVSKSGRVVLDPDDFNLEFPLVRLLNPNANAIEARWRVQPMFVDEFALPAKRNPFGDTVVTVAQGLSNGKHTIEITGGPETPIAAIRVYRPPLGR